MKTDPKTLQEVKEFAQGRWNSISVELRPTEDRTGIGNIQPTFLQRDFTYLQNDQFEGTITMFGDNYGQFPLMKFEFKGHLKWGNRHPIAEGAWEIDYVLDQGFVVVPLVAPAAEMLNFGRPSTIPPFQVNVANDILKKPFPLFNIAEGKIVVDYDLIYFKNDLLFMGAKHVDGRPFDKPENRPNQLQIPLQRL